MRGVIVLNFPAAELIMRPYVIRANWFNYINLTSADTSGMLRFLTDELQDAEDAGDRGRFLFYTSLHADEAGSSQLKHSLDLGTCSQWMGRHECVGKSDEFV